MCFLYRLTFLICYKKYSNKGSFRGEKKEEDRITCYLMREKHTWIRLLSLYTFNRYRSVNIILKTNKTSASVER